MKHPLISVLAIIDPHNNFDNIIEDFMTQTYPVRELILLNNAKSQFEASSLTIDAIHTKDEDTSITTMLYDLPKHCGIGEAYNYGTGVANGQILTYFSNSIRYDKEFIANMAEQIIEHNCEVTVLNTILSYSYFSGATRYTNTHDILMMKRQMGFDHGPTDIDHRNMVRKLRTKYKIIEINKPELCYKIIASKNAAINVPINRGVTKEHFDVIYKFITDKKV